jgi:hypothetical protein
MKLRSVSLKRPRQSRRTRCLLIIVGGSVVTAMSSLSALAVSNDVTWLGGNSSWGDASRWSAGVVPLNSGSNTFNVFIPVNLASANVIAVNYGNGHTSSIDTLTLTSSTINIGDTDRLDVINHLVVNSGAININGATSFTTFSLIGGGTISGGGVITMGNNANNHIRTETPNTRITNVDNLIQGSGNIAGDQSMALTNSGTILANQIVPLRFIPGFNTTSFNTGWMRATSAAELQIQGTATLNNSGGTIAATSGGSVTLIGAIKISGGVLSTDAIGVIRSGTDGTTTCPRLTDLTNAGALQLLDGKDITIAGTINNTGSITLDTFSSSLPSTLLISGDTTLSGAGTVNLQLLTSITSATPTDRLINAGNTIRGAGSLGNNSMNLTNRGTMIGTTGRGLTIDPSAEALNDTTGVWSAATGGVLVLSGNGSSSFVNNGTITVASGGTLIVNTGAILTGYGIFNDGRTTLTSGAAVNVASITGAGTTALTVGAGVTLNYIRGNALSISHSTLSINTNGTSSGTSVVTSLTIIGTGSMDLHDNDLVIDYGASTPLDSVRTMIGIGSLTSSQAAASTTPKTALGYLDNTAGQFTTFSGQSVDNTSVLIKYTYAGDANLDGQVDVTDLGALATNWQTSNVWTGGDFNYDGFVDVSDLGILASNWQAGVGDPLGPSFAEAMTAVGLAVPEPGAVALLVGGSAACVRRGRRR